PYAQMLVVPRKVLYDVQPMSEEVSKARQKLDGDISRLGGHIAKNKWADHVGYHFDDKYKVLQQKFLSGGMDAVHGCVADAEDKWQEKKDAQDARKKRFKRRLVATRDETLPHQKAEPPSLDLHFGDEGSVAEATDTPQADADD